MHGMPGLRSLKQVWCGAVCLVCVQAELSIARLLLMAPGCRCFPALCPATLPVLPCTLLGAGRGSDGLHQDAAADRAARAHCELLVRLGAPCLLRCAGVPVLCTVQQPTAAPSSCTCARLHAPALQEHIVWLARSHHAPNWSLSGRLHADRCRPAGGRAPHALVPCVNSTPFPQLEYHRLAAR